VLYAVNAASGELTWKAEAGGFGVTPALSGDMVIAGGGQDGILHALDAATGSERWQVADGAEVGASAAILDDTVFIIGADTTLLALDLQSGAEKWRADVDAPGGLGVTYPAVSNGLVYVVDAGALHAFDASNGTEIWTYATASAQSSPSVAGGVIYTSGVAFDGTITAIDASTGAELWQVTTGEMSPLSSPAVAGGLVIVGSFQNVIAFGSP
jgi:outer membrane protein assembly factor BamB